MPKSLILILPRDRNLVRMEALTTYGGAKAAPQGNLEFMNGGNSIGAGGVVLAQTGPLQLALQSLARTLYLDAFRNAINAGGQQNYYDIVVGQEFLRAWKTLKGGKIKAHADAAIKLTNDIRELFGFDSLEINTAADDSTLMVAVNQRTFRLDELGSGLSQFILVLATAATRQQDLILIDEPELNLHPSLQVDFLTTVGTFAREGVIFGTHSMGLARSVAQQIYALRRERVGLTHVRPYESAPRLAEFLGELSFSGYKELGFQKVLLVEGPHDVTTVQQWLRQLHKDHTIVLLPLGGNTMINGNREAELHAVCRISPDVHALIDSERPAAGAQLSPDRQAFVDSCKALDIDCHVLTLRALESYFPDRAVKEIKGEAYSRLAPYDRLANVQPAWGKAENWKIARAMSAAELAATDDLSVFLQNL